MRKRIIMMIMGVALIALPIMAQQQEWKSTSAMQTSGSAYTPQVTEVGATAVTDNATTTETYSPAKAPGGPRKMGESGRNPGDPGYDSKSDQFPIGDAVLPLMLCAAVFCGFIAFRRKRSAVKGGTIKSLNGAYKGDRLR